MADVTALGKRACPDCGGEMEWNAGKQALVCPYCGFVPSVQPGAADENAPIAEHDLEQALAQAGSGARGYGTETQSVKCQSCHAISVFEPGRAAQRCEFCGSPSVVAYSEERDPIAPESILPVKLAETEVRDRLREWYRTRWFAPDRLKTAALTDTLHGVYLPYWTFDAQAFAQWSAEAGYYYYTTVSSRDAQGRETTTRVRHVRWVPAAGSLQHFFDDTLIAGTVGVAPKLLQQVEPFPTTTALQPYDPGFVRGWVVERYQIDLRQAASRSEARMMDELKALCAREVPGDTHRNLDVSAQFAERTFKHVLVPVWLVSYDFHGKAFQVLVNGYTGTIAGERPISWLKVFFYVVIPALLVLGALGYWKMNQYR